jgi:asparagine synthase (glutamine-hydrolysing)
MCGIAALSCSAPDTCPRADRHRDDVRSALGRLAHRGPDDEGVHLAADGRTVLGHRRLSVIDPAGGHQPLLAPDGAAVVANGMIYNDLALRDRLAHAPYRTGSDTESILHLVREEGPAAVARLDGMFAFVHVSPDRVVAARDPLGIKPLYRATVDGEQAFASEVKAFDGLAERVEEFPPGHVYDSRTGTTAYYRLPEPQSPGTSTGAAVAELRDALEAAVVKRLRSDVPFGALLSGGLDSSLVCALARPHVDELHTFAVGLPGSPDLLAARTVAEHLDTRHHELVVDPAEVRAALPQVLHHLESADVDLVRSAVGTWLVMAHAAEHVTVVLTGEGADELFAGYAYHAAYDDPDVLQAELHRSLAAMHSVNLQRVDRMSMAHGVEARVPFLDTSVVDVAMRTPPALKHRDPAGGRRVEKWVLRAVADGLLPEEVVWRPKAQFDEGSGLADLLPRLAGPSSGDRTADRAAEGGRYRELLSTGFLRPEQVLAVAGTWESGRLAVTG